MTKDWKSAHDLAEMVVDSTFKQALTLYVLSRFVSPVKMNDLIDDAKEKITPKFEKIIDSVIDTLVEYGFDLEDEDGSEVEDEYQY